ncbi:MAG TPA: hypothetical protein ENI51_02285 [Candidatus Atribacteria bacterium]|nr:hypothetical protein [Candidatus Atribacteria bacterium]
MICLTGDVHHYTVDTPELRFLSSTLSEATLTYVDIAMHYNIKLTLFFTGKSIEEDYNSYKNLFNEENIEIGGHTYNMLRKTWVEKIMAKLFNSRYGSFFYQKKDIHKTINVIKQATNKDVYAWRTHSYKSDWITYRILKNTSVKIVSDEKSNNKILPEKLKNGLVSFPINVMPDHEHLYHGERTITHVANLKWDGDAFGRQSFTADEWLLIVRKQIDKILRCGGVATLLVHPQCMDVVDRFKTFKKLCEFISKFNSVTLSEALNLLRSRELI